MRKQPRNKSLSGVCRIELERHLATSIIRLHGEFDVSAEQRFAEKLEAVLGADTATVVLDLRGLTFMDSTGLRMLVTVNHAAERDGFDFAILCDGGNVRQLLRDTGLDGILPVVDPSGAVPPYEAES